VCLIRTQAGCNELQGTWGGANSRCYPGSCRAGCPCDWNDDGDLSQADITAFITAYQAQNADFDGDGDTDTADIAGFLACYQTDPDC
jgi:hypothetical protein